MCFEKVSVAFKEQKKQIIVELFKFLYNFKNVALFLYPISLLGKVL